MGGLCGSSPFSGKVFFIIMYINCGLSRKSQFHIFPKYVCQTAHIFINKYLLTIFSLFQTKRNHPQRNWIHLMSGPRMEAAVKPNPRNGMVRKVRFAFIFINNIIKYILLTTLKYKLHNYIQFSKKSFFFNFLKNFSNNFCTTWSMRFAT